MTTEADTCRKFVVPKLQAAGWDSEPHSIAEQRSFTDGRIVVRGGKAERRKGKRADYLLRYTRDFPIAVTEAKAKYKKAADGLQHAKEYAAEKVRTLCASPNELRARWSDAKQRAEIIEQLSERGIDFQQVASQAGKPEADPFDLLCHLAFNAPVLTRRQRADRMKKQQAALFGYFAPEAREILNDLLEKYAADSELQFALPDVLKLPPISHHGNVAEIAQHFGGLEKLGNAVNQLQSLLYAA
jgi:type I site-specific restriction endonuclease